MRKIRHIGIIPDGTRRWAAENHVTLSEALHISMDKLSRLIDSAFMLVDEVSVYMLSKENLKRESCQLDVVLAMEDEFIRTTVAEVCRKHSVRVVHAGEKKYLPEYLNRSLELLCNETRFFDRKTLNLLVAYNAMDEIASACRRRGCAIGIEDLWVSSEVDLVIRTGGGRVMSSNFLPLQCAYSSYYVVDEYFNDFTEERFMEIYNTERAVNMNRGA